MKLKIFINTKAKKVMFAEAGKEFVDFLAQIMALPLSTVSNLLNEKGMMMGCHGTLYKSMASLDSDHFESSSANAVLMRPAAFVAVPLFSLNTAPTITYYQCEKHSTYISGCKEAVCPDKTCDLKMSTQIHHKTVPILGFVKEKILYLVMDNLEVKPLSVSHIKSFFKDCDCLEEKEVQIGRDEGLAILKASLERQDVLTSVFLQIKAE